jgi:hypothetical protein
MKCGAVKPMREDLDKEAQTLTRVPEFSAPKRGSSNRQKPNTC